MGQGSEMELYVHIPFCMKKCGYCDFLSFVADERTQLAYVQALIKELEFYGKKYKGRSLSTIYIGGGTPSWMSGDTIVQIMETIGRCFQIAGDAEISIECNPGTVTNQKLLIYRSIGINRLSIGLQSAHNEELKILGRIHTYEQFLKMYDRARTQGFSNINIDLMSSLPGQKPEVFMDSLQKVIRLKPEHISAYSLMIEEGTPFYDLYQADAAKQRAGMPTEFLPTEDEEYQTTKLTQQMLKEAGYHWYEISNFARPGKECRHNIGYWRRTEYLGLGLGAASLLDNVRYSNTRDISAYLKGCEEIGEVFLERGIAASNLHISAEAVSRSAQMEEFLFLGLRMTEGIRCLDFLEAFGVSVESVYEDVIEGLQREGLLQKEEGRIFLTERGMDISNYVMAQFLN